MKTMSKLSTFSCQVKMFYASVRLRISFNKSNNSNKTILAILQDKRTPASSKDCFSATTTLTRREADQSKHSKITCLMIGRTRALQGGLEEKKRRLWLAFALTTQCCHLRTRAKE
eukprot:TCONS_00023138-protein